MDCLCGCGTPILDIDDRGRPRQFVVGHAGRLLVGTLNHVWKGGRKRCNGYIKVKYSEHRKADDRGYVLEHWVKYEEYHKCSLLDWVGVHHDDEDRANNSY